MDLSWYVAVAIAILSGCSILVAVTLQKIEEHKVAKKPSTNNDYAAALRVIIEWDATYSTTHTIEKLREYCEKRLNSAKVPNCA